MSMYCLPDPKLKLCNLDIKKFALMRKICKQINSIR